MVSTAAAQLVSLEMGHSRVGAESSMWVQADQQAVPCGVLLIHIHRSGAGQKHVQPKLCTSLTTIMMPLDGILGVSIAQCRRGGQMGRCYKGVLQNPREAPGVFPCAQPESVLSSLSSPELMRR